MTSKITFQSLKLYLESLGCDFQPVLGKGIAFHHPPTNALIVLRQYRDDEVVTPTDLTIAAHVLDVWGVLPRQDFEAALQERALAG